MGILSNSPVAYRATLSLIHLYKWLELLFFRLIATRVQRFIRKSFTSVGVKIHGSNPWDIKVHNDEFFVRVANNMSMGLGESYMAGWWDCDNLVECVRRLLRNDAHRNYLNPMNKLINYMQVHYFNNQTKAKAWEVGEEHYDKGNDLFESFLDPAMNYSCGYWKTARNLTEAQIAKMDLIGQKLKLKPGMTVLDIGCGWGGLCKYLAEQYRVHVVGITISKEGAKLAIERCTGLPVDIRLMDYRDLNEKFDRIVSVGMFEHVGPNNYESFFDVSHRCLKDDGLFLLHTIGVNHHDIPLSEPWFDKYIFPNGILPYYKHITEFTEKKFVIEDWHNFGYDYSKTLIAWHENFKRSWPKLESKYGEKFFRMWSYYLQFSAGCFQSRKFQLWQVVLSKNGFEGGYESPR